MIINMIISIINSKSSEQCPFTDHAFRIFSHLKSISNFLISLYRSRYLTHSEDILTMVEGMKIAMAIGHTTPFLKFGAKMFDTVFPTCTHYP